MRQSQHPRWDRVRRPAREVVLGCEKGLSKPGVTTEKQASFAQGPEALLLSGWDRKMSEWACALWVGVFGGGWSVGTCTLSLLASHPALVCK